MTTIEDSLVDIDKSPPPGPSSSTSARDKRSGSPPALLPPNKIQKTEDVSITEESTSTTTQRNMDCCDSGSSQSTCKHEIYYCFPNIYNLQYIKFPVVDCYSYLRCAVLLFLRYFFIINLKTFNDLRYVSYEFNDFKILANKWMYFLL